MWVKTAKWDEVCPVVIHSTFGLWCRDGSASNKSIGTRRCGQRRGVWQKLSSERCCNAAFGVMVLPSPSSGFPKWRHVSSLWLRKSFCGTSGWSVIPRRLRSCRHRQRTRAECTTETKPDQRSKARINGKGRSAGKWCNSLQQCRGRHIEILSRFSDRLSMWLATACHDWFRQNWQRFRLEAHLPQLETAFDAMPEGSYTF